MNQKKEEVWDMYDDPTMLDVAASIINSMLVAAAKEKKPMDEIQMYHREERALWSSDKSLSRSMLDKAINYYGPIVKARYADPDNWKLRINMVQDNIFDDPTMLDVAASIINDMLVTAIKEDRPDDEVQMYHIERDALWGTDKTLSRSMLDKTINYYGPIVRARYAEH